MNHQQEMPPTNSTPDCETRNILVFLCDPDMAKEFSFLNNLPCENFFFASGLDADGRPVLEPILDENDTTALPPIFTFSFLIDDRGNTSYESKFDDSLLSRIFELPDFTLRPLFAFSGKGAIFKENSLHRYGIPVDALPEKREDLTRAVNNFLAIHSRLKQQQSIEREALVRKDLAIKIAKENSSMILRDLEKTKSEVELQTKAQEAVFDMSRQELLILNERIKKQYEAEIRVIQERNRIESIFGKYVSREIVDQVLDPEKSGALDGVRKNISVLFADLRGFTSMSEDKTPEKIIFVLNEFFTEMTEIIHKQKGWVDKYAGDNIMALFGAPVDLNDHATRCIQAAMEMQRIFRTIKHEWKQLLDINIGLGIGIASGPVVVGNIGSFQKISYTAIGDTVNVAARLESVAPDGMVYINQECYDRIATEKREGFGIKFRGEETVKGRSKLIHVYESAIYDAPFYKSDQRLRYLAANDPAADTANGPE